MKTNKPTEPIDERKWEAVWAEEAGIMFRAERLKNGKVHVAIIDDQGNTLRDATIGSWRWERLTERVKP